jgi:hypothetical protein
LKRFVRNEKKAIMPDYQLKTEISAFNLKKSDTLCSATTFFTVAV